MSTDQLELIHNYVSIFPIDIIIIIIMSNQGKTVFRKTLFATKTLVDLIQSQKGKSIKQFFKLF